MKFTDIHKQPNSENCFFIKRRKTLMEIPLRRRSPEEVRAYQCGWENGIKWARSHPPNPLSGAIVDGFITEQDLGHAS